MNHPPIGINKVPTLIRAKKPKLRGRPALNALTKQTAFWTSREIHQAIKDAANWEAKSVSNYCRDVIIEKLKDNYPDAL